MGLLYVLFIIFIVCVAIIFLVGYIYSFFILGSMDNITGYPYLKIETNLAPTT